MDLYRDAVAYACRVASGAKMDPGRMKLAHPTETGQGKCNPEKYLKENMHATLAYRRLVIAYAVKKSRHWIDGEELGLLSGAAVLEGAALQWARRLLASFQDPCEENPDCTLRLTDLLDEGLCELIGSLDDKTMTAAAMQMEADFPELAAAFKTVTRMMI